ncbi:MAG: DUF58 domain-containing protein [Gammaproteobacteria bacterium]|nr:DUF58 domain-containing protein [Gammaproteobacteria bacterium]|tara:strand:- start:987 stop:1955 length:969 start_codon:yes stop_codon:yes gene_type:complete
MAEAAAQRFVGQRWRRWLDRRIPPSPQIRLSQRNIFIFPTQTGFVFGGLLILLIVGAINYQASLVYAVAFLLGSMFLMTILYTFRNLSGLTLELASTRPGFVDEDIEFVLKVGRPKGRGREGIQLGWPEGIKQWAELYDQEADTIRLFMQAKQRGYLRPGRLLVETYYPLGLLRAWTWVDLEIKSLVYPRPIFGEFPHRESGSRSEGELVDPFGSDDFTDIREYQAGDPTRHILWRSYARSDAVMIKRYSSYLEPRLWLDLEDVSGSTEERLSRLTGLALQATRLENEFGLRLGELVIKPAIGEAHLEHVLRELALYGIRER